VLVLDVLSAVVIILALCALFVTASVVVDVRRATTDLKRLLAELTGSDPPEP
jgi:hypothetical protein